MLCSLIKHLKDIIKEIAMFTALSSLFCLNATNGIRSVKGCYTIAVFVKFLQAFELTKGLGKWYIKRQYFVYRNIHAVDMLNCCAGQHIVYSQGGPKNVQLVFVTNSSNFYQI